MTIDEAQAFVGDEPCNIKTLTETDLYCEPPEVQPQPKKRQKRDMINNLPEFIVGYLFSIMYIVKKLLALLSSCSVGLLSRRCHT